MKLIAFDLEGPLSPNDHANELMSLFPQGERVFEIISRYDDLLTLEEKEGYEPGDTLSLILPFLIYHGIGETDIHRLASSASLTPGVKELISQLHAQRWQVLCITTTYMPYALTLTQRLGIPASNVAATPLPLAELARLVPASELTAVAQLEREILPLQPVSDDYQIKRRLDHFFWAEPPPSLASALQRVKPVGGKRKTEALVRLAPGQPLSQIAVVGDSITDFKLLRAVDEGGGLAIAFNANEYALPYATMSLASVNILDLYPVLEAWAQGGRELVKQRLTPGKGDRGHLHWRKEGELPVELHRRTRHLLRSKAAELG